MKNIRLGVIGCGNMAQAIVQGLTADEKKSQYLADGFTFRIFACDTLPEKAAALQRYGVKATSDLSELIACSDYILLAVKPQSAPQSLKGFDFSDKIVISIMAGTSLASLQEIAQNGRCVRVMPNLNARVGLSYNAFSSNQINAEEEQIVRVILDSFGTTTRVDENKMNAVTGLTGSAPAFVFQFIESFIEAGINRGFSPIVARQMALSMIIGSTKLVENSSQTPISELIENVCSKGGTTIEGVNFLRENRFSQLVQGAVEKSILRAEELEKGQ